VDHLIWHCERFGSERHRLIDALSELDVQHGTPVRDLCGLRKWSAIKCCLDFLGSLRIRFWSDSLSVDVELEIRFIGPFMASASGPSRIRVTFKKKKKITFKMLNILLRWKFSLILCSDIFYKNIGSTLQIPPNSIKFRHTKFWLFFARNIFFVIIYFFPWFRVEPSENIMQCWNTKSLRVRDTFIFIESLEKLNKNSLY
jgi:hypothetical protein